MGSDDDIGFASTSSEVNLPKATVNKFANDIAHSLDVRLTADTRDLIATCCSEFVQLISSEANDICEKDKKKTITPEHIIRALQQLGLDRFQPQVEDEYERAKIEEAKQKQRLCHKRERNKAALKDPEELQRRQEELFALARSEDPMDLRKCISGGTTTTSTPATTSTPDTTTTPATTNSLVTTKAAVGIGAGAGIGSGSGNVNSHPIMSAGSGNSVKSNMSLSRMIASRDMNNGNNLRTERNGKRCNRDVYDDDDDDYDEDDDVGGPGKNDGNGFNNQTGSATMHSPSSSPLRHKHAQQQHRHHHHHQQQQQQQKPVPSP